MDYIYVTDENNNEKQMEVVSTFKLDGYNFNYIIYCELDKSHFYIAKYRDNIDDLDTNLSDKEINLCNIIFEEIMKWN